MSLKLTNQKAIKDFKLRYAIDATDENVVNTLHIMNTHLIDRDSALDQSSLGSGDYGIDGWYLKEDTHELFIYQSKLTDSKPLALKGLRDLLAALSFIEKVLLLGDIDKIPTNKSTYNLFITLSKLGIEKIKTIHLILVTNFNPNDLYDYPDVIETEKAISNSKLYKSLLENGAKISLDIQEYNFEKSVARSYKKYSINKLEKSKIELKSNSFLEITFIQLSNLVELYRQRGDILFEKNVRLSLYDYKDSKNRVVTPMENTLLQICKGKLNPNIFPFYHVGITISGTTNSSDVSSEISLETPSVINGCQTITIAERFLRELENKKI